MSMGHGSGMGKQQNVYNSKYNLKESIKSTPGAMATSKIGVKKEKSEQMSTSSTSNAQQPHPGNL